MRAAVHTRYGPPEVVRVTEADVPTAGNGELLIKVHATTVNRTDCGYRAAKPFIVRAFSGLRRPRRTVLGNEFAGEVVEVGPGVTRFVPGERVFGYSEGRFGAHAEYMAVREDGPITTIPDGVTFEQAAPGNEGSHYALAYIRAAKIRSGQAVLVYGATGAIGSAAVQLLKTLGARVTAVCATEQLELVRGLGADRVIDYTVEDFTRDNQVYDVVLDAVGKSSFAACKGLLRPRGVFMATDICPFPYNPILALLTRLRPGKRVMFPVPRHDRQTAEYLGELIASGRFVPVIDRRYPLEEIVEAYRYVETGQKIGNVVITVAPGDARPG
jgi:NADPH:quinone reductase-like Zn-dependent oxidoreductase